MRQQANNFSWLQQRCNFIKHMQTLTAWLETVQGAQALPKTASPFVHCTCICRAETSKTFQRRIFAEARISWSLHGNVSVHQSFRPSFSVSPLTRIQWQQAKQCYPQMGIPPQRGPFRSDVQTQLDPFNISISNSNSTVWMSKRSFDPSVRENASSKEKKMF